MIDPPERPGSVERDNGTGKAPTPSDRSPLAAEVEAFRRELPNLQEHRGEYVVVHGGKVLAFAPSRQEAARKGYSLVGMKPFLIEQISIDGQPRVVDL